MQKSKEVSRERINEIAYALLLTTLSKQDVQLDPDQLKRKIGNLPQNLKFLPRQFTSFSQEELQEACKIICHDLVDYAFSFSLGKNKQRKRK